MAGADDLAIGRPTPPPHRLGGGSPWLRAGALAAALVLGLVLCGCGGPPVGLLQVAVDPPPGTDRVDLLAVTTRAPATEPGLLFGSGRGGDVAITSIEVSIPPDRQVGTVQFPRTLPGNPSTDFVATAVTPLSRNAVPAWFNQSGGKKRRVFLFVHGFNTRFDVAVLRFAQLAHDVDADAAPVLFSWPSQGRLLGYRADIDNATYARSDLADVIRAALRSPAVSDIVIMAHSMGAWPTTEALREIALQDGGIPGKISNVVLASPDLDVGVFRRQIADMGQRRPHITLFTSRNDKALQLSGWLSGGLTRLGALDASNEDYRDEFRGLKGVTVIDLSALSSGDRINHDLFAASPLAVRLIGDRLLQGQVVTDSDVVATNSALEAIGSAAGLVVAAPILIVEGAASR